MSCIDFYGLDSSYIPLSKAFSIDIINHEINLSSFNKITKVSFSIDNKFFNNFSLIDKNYTSILLSFNIRIDYISSCDILKYNVSTFDKIIHICTGDTLAHSSTKIYSEIVNCDIFDMDNSSINLCLIFSCSLGI